jgi:Cys-tRNA(Pro)/Cys-tRNA(Cys) deacylase
LDKRRRGVEEWSGSRRWGIAVSFSQVARRRENFKHLWQRSNSMKKTNAVRYLDSLKIDYKLLEYEVDESDLSAESVARKVNLPLEQVFKTLVARGDKTGVLMACIPGNTELDLKAMATVSGNKNVEMVHVGEIQQLTGYVRGGVSPIGTKKHYLIFLDESAMKFPFISISAGVRGSQIFISPGDLIKALDIKVCRIARLK